MSSEIDLGKNNVKTQMNSITKTYEQKKTIETNYLKPTNHVTSKPKNPINPAAVLNKHKKVNNSSKQINDLNA
jgi:hypothetical protein